MASEDNATKEKDGIDINLRNVPMDVVDELDRRAEKNFRSRTGEILSILVTECRKPAVGSVAPISREHAQALAANIP